GRGIVVHSEPIAHDPGGHGGGNGGGGGGRSRRGRSKGGGSDSQPTPAPEEETDAHGRTPAQIAAAAHAAAVKHIAGEPAEDDVADLTGADARAEDVATGDPEAQPASEQPPEP